MGANIKIDFIPDGGDPYCKMFDDKGREYVLVPCDCRDCKRGKVPKNHFTTESVARPR